MKRRRSETSSLVERRRMLLENAGFGTFEAHRLARDARYDPFELIELVRRGFPPRLASKLVEPVIDDDSAA